MTGVSVVAILWCHHSFFRLVLRSVAWDALLRLAPFTSA